MSLLIEALEQDIDFKKSDIKDLVKRKLPYMNKIINNSFDTKKKSLKTLLKALTTYAYLGIDSKKIVKKIIWILGRSKKLFDEYFTESKEIKKSVYDVVRYELRSDIDKIIHNEIKRTYSKRNYTKEELSVRFVPYTNTKLIALAGNFKLLKWVRKNGCAWGNYTCSHAAKKGHFDILKWAIKNGCGWNELTCARAARKGHFDILKW